MGYSEAQQQEMLRIVSATLKSALRGKEWVSDKPDVEGLDTKSGCFVTLKKAGRLRGCIGCFVSDQPLYKTLGVYARASLLDDPRFAGSRLTLEDLSAIEIDISVLSPLKPCSDPENIRLGIDGIYVISSMGSGCFLPQVATETGWNVEEFWGNCCSHKAGLTYNAWRDSGVELYTFEAEVIAGDYQK